jgi:uncharacterized protein (DUF433 family)
MECATMTKLDQLKREIENLDLSDLSENEIKELLKFLEELPKKKDKPKGKRIPNLFPNAIRISDDFNDPLPEEFWAGTNSYIEFIERPSGITAVIKGTRISVWMIAEAYKSGLTPEDIFIYYDGKIKMQEIFDALAYYYENKDEIESLIKSNSIVDSSVIKAIKI